MLRLSIALRTAATAAALFASSASFGQSGGLSGRITDAGTKLDQDVQACRPVDLGEPQRLLHDAAVNKQRAEKAAKKGIPVDQAQVDADLANANALFNRAVAAHAGQCMRAAQQQPPPQTSPTPATTWEAPPGPRFQTGSLLDGIRNRAWAKIEEMKAADERCDAAAYERALHELEAILEETKLVRGAASGGGEFSNVKVEEAEGLVDAVRNIIEPRRWRLIELKRRCQPPAPAEPQTPKQTSMSLPSWARDILTAHNAARAAVGAPPLQWNPELQAHATTRAGELAQIRQLVHAPREGRGTERENILSAPIGYSPSRMIDLWSKESGHFRPGLFPDVSDTGNWMDVAHYTQMVWPTTTEIGCGYVPGGGFNWLVCRYNPGGNKDGKPVIRPRLIGGDYGNMGRPVLADNSGIAPESSATKAAAPPPPPPPTARDEAPGGNEDNHPLVGYGAEAFIRHSAAIDCGNTAAAEAELAKLRYALDELRKRLKAAKKAGNFSTVKPDDVQRQINLLESFLRAAEQRKPRGACPAPPPPPP